MRLPLREIRRRLTCLRAPTYRLCVTDNFRGRGLMDERKVERRNRNPRRTTCGAVLPFYHIHSPLTSFRQTNKNSNCFDDVHPGMTKYNYDHFSKYHVFRLLSLNIHTNVERRNESTTPRSGSYLDKISLKQCSLMIPVRIAIKKAICTSEKNFHSIPLIRNTITNEDTKHVAKEAADHRDDKKSLPADCKILRSRGIKIVSWRSESGTPVIGVHGKMKGEREGL